MTTITNSPYMDLLVEDDVEPAPKCAGEGVNPNIFDPKTQLDFNEAVSVCQSCPLKVQCQIDGITNEEHGVWGGVLLQSGRIRQPNFRDTYKRRKPKRQPGVLMTPEEFKTLMGEPAAV